MGTLLQDIRFGIRQLVKMPGFTLTAIVSLALGIGATTAVFSVVYAILLDPYPYKDPRPHDSHATAHAERGVARVPGRHRAAMASDSQVAGCGRFLPPGHS